MSYATYFPEQRQALAMTTIRRDRMMPEDAIGEVRASVGERVDLRDIVAVGTVPSRFVIIEAAKLLRLRDPDELETLMAFEIGEIVEAKQQLVSSKKKLLAPVTGVVAFVGDGRIILQETPEPIELEAGLIGQVVEVREPRGVVIETTGAVFQGVWGNDRLVIGTLKNEPPEGLESIFSDALNIEYQGTIVLTKRPIKPLTLQTIVDQELSGVIAPSMDASLIDQARDVQAAILLTEGFGSLRMSQFTVSFLEALTDRQVTLDASAPDRYANRRPEIIVNIAPRGSQRPPEPNDNRTLNTGMEVRLTRGQFAGMAGKITYLPKSPTLLENGLKVMCAQVQLITGESVLVPLANLESFGQ